jgi:hypothetical protein
MPALLDILRHAGVALARASAEYVELDAAARVLRLKERLVQLGADRARRRDETLQALGVTITDALRVAARSADGYRLSADVVPIALDVQQDTVRLRASVRGGVNVSHDRRLQSILAQTLDATLGVVQERLQSVPGLELDGDSLVYERRIEALTLLRSLGILEPNTTIPLRCEPGAVVLDLRGLSARVDWAQIARALLTAGPR